MRYLPHTQEEVEEMLNKIGEEDLETIF